MPEGVDRRGQAVADGAEPLADQDQVGVIRDIAARRPQVDDLAGVRRDVSQRMHMSHHVMPEPLLVGPRRLEVDVVDLRPQLLDLPLLDRQPEFFLCLGEGDPEPPPGRELPLRRPQLRHCPAGIADHERVFI